MNWRRTFIFIAGACFVLAAFGVDFLGLSLGWLGLAFYMASEISTT